jgi:hypothetical protein
MAATSFKIDNPVGVSTFQELIGKVSQGLLTIAIPIAVIMYVWAGVLYLTAGANPSNVGKAKNVLWYTTIGLVVIFIGGGFVNLIQSVINAGN